mmetsp:Transcript_25302/g.28949  ORF Transcript_25302/g.28949 Transcript_25302/m.28949 type:complete len:355 (+) Transcript_25302:63-1127(+)|eukprot:CAMPEP_0114984384 /NCGR_PEP_ID=MMETSP0216-20121206/7246_1 /TAXON_ID=223996 /ORGANISM="Protocruzia adherens, Strain Boccale" /LENGTH=354 /DNA_ID=CAMNT_0002346513 /DNA_START=62 /DNA_END=1126 /DNA_ORIENTATION=-
MRSSIARNPKKFLSFLTVRPFSAEAAREHWFPRTIDELDSHKYQKSVSGEINTAFLDTFIRKEEEYQDRARAIKTLAADFTPGQAHNLFQRIPNVVYTEEETAVWKDVWDRLDVLQQKLACEEFLFVKQKLIDADILSPNEIPQMENVSNYIEKKSGFELRPAPTFTGPRQFLNSLAFKVFYCPQFVRPQGKAMYSVLPDVIHTYLGHAALISQPVYAEIFQDIGIASLGISDKEIHELYAIYWYAVEQGLILKPGPKVKVTGAHLLANIRQLEKIENGEVNIKGFNLIEVLSRMDGFTLQEHDKTLFIAENYMGIQDIIHEFATSCKRPFKLYFNQETHSVDVCGKTHMFMGR